MPANILDGLLELSHQILSFSESFDNDTKVLGQSISDDLATMLGLNLNPRQVCWTPRHLKQDVFEDVYNNLDETPNHPPPSKDIFEIDDAYLGSKSTLSAIMECVCQSMLTSGQFRDPENCLCEFQELEEYCIHDEMYLESGFTFCTPSKPHVTIISIQPQQGPPNNLVLTELYTLMYWACRYAWRGKNISSLPIRVVSICDTKARFLSANFSHGYFKRVPVREDETGEGPTIMEVNIGRYYDMQEKEDFLQFMKQLVDVPKFSFLCPVTDRVDFTSGLRSTAVV